MGRPVSTVDLFESLLAAHGDSPRALDWSVEGQRKRFGVLWEMGLFYGRVLDVGCGLGHFYDYLRHAGFSGSYVGVDFSTVMIQAAQRRLTPAAEYAAPSAHFKVLNALTDELPEADFVVSSGLLNVQQGDNFAAMKLLLAKCFNASRVGCAVNMLSTSPPSRRIGRYYYNPSQMLDIAFALTPFVTLRHDYRDNDFTLYLYRRERH